MAKKTLISFIGCGNMAQAMINGMLSQNFKANSIAVFDIDQAKAKRFAHSKKIKSFADINEMLSESQVLILAIKPQEIKSVLSNTAAHLSNKLIISIAAGVECKLIAHYAKNSCIVRSMPNNPALIGEGITGIYSNKITSSQKKMIEDLFKGCGDFVWVKQEALLDVVTGLSGSGPAYVYAFVDALTQAGKKLGLEEGLSYRLALKTLSGSANTLLKSGKSPTELIPLVTSKKGTTLEGLKVLKANKLSSILYKTVKAAALRAKQIRKELLS